MASGVHAPLPPIEDPYINDSGLLDVGDGHVIYWIDWGNKQIANPIFFLHGGPGSGFSERDFAKFNPKTQRVIFHDQRGAGRSTPFGSIEHNTTQDLISDITKLRQKLNIRSLSLYGRSWGSTLALLYAINKPGDIEKMLLGGIYLARTEDSDFYLNGHLGYHFPDVWNRYIGSVPEIERQNIGAFYKQKLDSKDENERFRYAREWARLESSVVKLDNVPANIENYLKADSIVDQARLEAHYILNGCFIEDNYIINNIQALDSVGQIILVHGRYDFVCMPSGAFDLKQALGERTVLHMVLGGHSGGEPVIREVEQAYINLLWP